MKQSIKDESQGTLHEVKGKVKEEIGKAANDADLEAKRSAGRSKRKSARWKRFSESNARLFSSLAVGTPSCFRVPKPEQRPEQGTDVPPAPSSRQWCLHRRECNFLLPAKEEVKIRAFSTGEHFLRYLPQSCRTTLSSESFTCRPPS